MFFKCSSSETRRHSSNSLANTAEFLAQKFQVSCHQSTEVYSQGFFFFFPRKISLGTGRVLLHDCAWRRESLPSLTSSVLKQTISLNMKEFFCCVTAAGENYSLCNLVKTEA